jgi:hypothetical protein
VIRKREKVNKDKSEITTNTVDSKINVLPNKEAAHKNMKPKTAYLLGSPENSDSEEDEDDDDDGGEPTIKNKFQGKFLL